MNKDAFDFDNVAKDYRKIHSKNVRLSGAKSEYFSKFKVINSRKLIKNEILNILDIGCGDGLSEVYFEKYFSKAQIYGVDVSQESITACKKRMLTKSKFKQFDGINLPFENNEFDLIFISCVFHHVNRKVVTDLLDECKRVLKIGGQIHIYEHNPNNPVTRYFVNTCMFDREVKLISKEALRKLVENSGFKILDTNFLLFFPRWNLFKFLLPLEEVMKHFPLGGQYLIYAKKR